MLLGFLVQCVVVNRVQGFKKHLILIFLSNYLPGFKSGGPVRTIANFVENLGGDFDIYIVTADRDLGSQEPYEGIDANQWLQVGDASVMYLPPRSQNFAVIKGLIDSVPHDVLYLNSFFSPRFTLLPLLASRLTHLRKQRIPIVVAPRGEFSSGALGMKTFKKKAFILAAKLTGLYRDVIWQASSTDELSDVITIFPEAGNRVEVAVDMAPPAARIGEASPSPYPPVSDDLRLVFLSRINRMKNLDYALTVLRKYSGSAVFDIYGPIEDDKYWQECKKIIDEMPENISITYKGELSHSQVHATLGNYDLFFLPTRGENYGHVIAEALTAGTPLLISNNTLWKNLEQLGVGWDIPLSEKTQFVRQLELFAALSEGERREMREASRRYALKKLRNPSAVEANRQLFLNAIHGQPK